MLMFNAPSFWKTKNIISLLLYPFSILYLWISKIKYLMQTPNHFGERVICIGNVTVGGSGKTPLAIAVGRMLLRKKNKIAYACKNYGASIKKPTQVTVNHNADQIIDEAFLLFDIAPTFVAKERREAVRMAGDAAKIIISDDGLQNNSFHKDLSILAVPKDIMFGNNFIFPAGPLRESLRAALKRTDLAVMIDEDGDSHLQSRRVIKKYFDQEKIFNVKVKYKLIGSNKKKYIAFCGIAHPDNFFTTLAKQNIKLIDKINYPDHYNYTEKDLQKLFSQAKESKVGLITTEKDFVRLSEEHRKKISYLKMEFEILNEKRFAAQINSI